MIARVVELCFGVIFLTLTFKEIVFPLMFNQPLFPMIRKTVKDIQDENK